MPSDSTAQTAQTYDSIASRYFEKWRDRSPIETYLKRFSAMIHAYGLQKEIILDVGCGPGFDTYLLCEMGLRVIGIDLSLGMLKVGQARYPVSLLQADMRYLPVTGLIGGLWVSASLLHLQRKDASQTLSQFAGLLLPGGLLYLSIKLGEGHSWTNDAYGQPRYFTYWQPDEIDTHLADAGFNIVDGWQGDGINDQWIIRFARKSIGRNEINIAS